MKRRDRPLPFFSNRKICMVYLRERFAIWRKLLLT